MGSKGIAAQLAFAATLLTVAGSAQAVDYWRLDFGYSESRSAKFTDKESSDGLMCGDPACTTSGSIGNAGEAGVFSAGAGWNLNNEWRLDVSATDRLGYEFSQAFPDSTTIQADVSSLALMGNLYKDFRTSWGTPYLGVNSTMYAGRTGVS